MGAAANESVDSPSLLKRFNSKTLSTKSCEGKTRVDLSL